MQIPRSYKLLGHTIRVRLIPADKWKDEGAVGVYSSERKEILVRDTHDTLTEHSFFHEMVHSVYDALGMPEFSDEGKVDSVAGVLHQIMTTAKFANTSNPRQPRRSRKRNSGTKTKR